MKNIKVSMLALSLVSVSASASNVPAVVTPSVDVAPVTTSASWFKMPCLPKVSMPNLPAVPATVAQFIPDNKYAQAAIATAVVAGAGYLTYKYGKTACNKIASVIKFVFNKAIEHKYKVLTGAVVVAAAVAGYKYGVHTAIADKVAALAASANARFAKASVASAVPVETPKKKVVESTETLSNALLENIFSI